ARAWIDAPDAATIAADLAWLSAPGHHVLAWTSEDFPALLRDIPAPPAALFVDGDVSHLWQPQIAIVGARTATPGGLSNARAFAQTFAQAGLSVTSGLAEGIDGAAHASALDAGGATVAVLGTGLDVIYPRRHEALAARIVGNGALVSEFPPGTPARPEHFPRRNRIIAGLSLGTLVIEAGLQSGSLITARLAAEQGRDVFALPGSIHSPLARGCHRLIRDGARLVESAEEVLAELHGMSQTLAAHLRTRLDALPKTPESAPASSQTPSHGPDYERLLHALDHTPAALDELSARTGLPAGALASMLLVLELEGAVQTQSGRYARAG
ncbi:MAG TPA: DNA-processing protein DprA, partial [Rudaea sp.]